MRERNTFAFIAGLTVLAGVSFLVRQPANVPEVAAKPAQTAPAQVGEAHRKFTWRDIASSNYPSYLEKLRQAGCPERRLRELVIADVDEFFAAKRLQEAIIHDEEWWRAEPQAVIRDLLGEKLRALALERRGLLEKFLGTNAPSGPVEESRSVALTGPVLGALAGEVRVQVDEIYSQSIDRSELAAVSADFTRAGPNPVEAARRREQTRRELRVVLSGEQLEEFLIRHSYNAGRLRAEFRGLGLTADEFRNMFRALDPIDHQMQLEYGSASALSEKQKARYVAQRDEALSKVLSAQRFEAYLATRHTGITASLP